MDKNNSQAQGFWLQRLKMESIW